MPFQTIVNGNTTNGNGTVNTSNVMRGPSINYVQPPINGNNQHRQTGNAFAPPQPQTLVRQESINRAPSNPTLQVNQVSRNSSIPHTPSRTIT